VALPAGEGGEAAEIAVAVAGLRQMGWRPLLVGRRPGLGLRVMRAGQAALEGLVRRGVAPRAIAAALAGYGARAPALAAAGTATALVLPADEIVARWLAAQANEGLRTLDQGLARRPSDIDLALVLGHGFPRWQGGPMHQADRRGLMALRRDLRLWAEADPGYAPAPLLDRLIRDGLRLADLDSA
jgi:3-hydroxyacyl-CoA dehydrogenase